MKWWVATLPTSSGNCSRTIKENEQPENWDKVIEFTQSPRNSFEEIRNARPDQQLMQKAMLQFVGNSKSSNSKINEGYIKAMGMTP